MSTLLLTPAEIDAVKTIAFSVENDGWYLIRISARLKGEKQRAGQQTNDEDMVVKVDDYAFPKLAGGTAVIDSPAAFSGGTQQNQEKTVIIVIRLGQGDHVLILKPQFRAAVTSATLEKADIEEGKLKVVQDEQSVERDSAPWITIATVGLDAPHIIISAKIWWRWLDGDDIKVRINGVIITNSQSVRHRTWLFASRAVWDLFGREQTERLPLPVSSAQSANEPIRYVELWADRQPLLQEVSLVVQNAALDLSEPSLASYSPGFNDADYNKFDRDIVKAVEYWNNEFTRQQFPPSEPLDPNLVKAMMYVESKMGYFPTPEGSYPSMPDVMQIADPRNPAIHTLNHDEWIDSVTGEEAREYSWTPQGAVIMNYAGQARANTAYESSYWAVRWLYHKAEKINADGTRTWRSWSETVKRYNGGGDTVYVQKVYDVYNRGDWR